MSEKFEFQTPVRDYSDPNNRIIVQDVMQPDAIIEERIKKAERGELKARLAQVLERGVLLDRFQIDMPPDVHGEWVRNNPLEIIRMKAMGFQVDDVYAPARAINSNGDNSAVIGDVIHMTCPKEYKDIIDEIRHEDKMKAHNRTKTKSGTDNREENEFKSTVKNDQHVRAVAESKERSVTASDIEAAVRSVDSQTKKYD